MSGPWPALALLPMLLAGCATVVEEPRAVRPGAPAQWRDSPTAPRDTAGRWWQDYGDPQLTGLVETALVANADVAMAGERLALARARLAVAGASGSPTVRGSAGYQRQRVPGQRTPDLDEAGELIFLDLPPYLENRRELRLTLAYEIDLFGRVARARAAGQALAGAAEHDREAVRLLVAREVVHVYAELRLAEAQAVLAGRRAALARQHLDDEMARGALGLADRSARDAAQAQVDDAVRDESGIRRVQAVAQAQLATLVGQDAAALRLAPAALPAAVLRVAPDLPADVLARRPDLQNAWLGVEASRIGIEQARLQRFPHLNLTSSLGFVSNALGGFLRQDYLGWALAAGVDWLLLDRGRTQAEVDAARAELALALAQHRKVMLGALREVEEALADWQAAGEAGTLAAVARQRSELQLRDARANYELGRTDRRGLILAELRLLDARSGVLQRQADRIQAYAALNAALGR